jgi:hypothetical protein
MLREIFDLKQASKLSISTKDKSMGSILVNGRELDLSFDFGGMYHPGLTVSVTAVPADGYKFVGWDVKKGDINNPSAETITFQMEKAVTLHAIFEKE